MQTSGQIQERAHFIPAEPKELTQEQKLALLAAIVESSSDAIISKSLEGIITSWNHAAQRVFGYTAAEVIGKSVSILIPPDRQEEEIHILERLKRGERVEHFETKRLTKDKRLLDISLTISPVKDPHGNIIGASKIARDITEQKKVERQIRESEEALRIAHDELKKMEQRKDDFIRMASHELKTPITSIYGYAQLLLSMYDEPSVEKLQASGMIIKSSLHSIEKQVTRLSRLVSEMLDLSRIETGKLEMQKSTFDIATLVEETIEDVRHSSLRHLIQVRKNYSGNIFGDRDRIGQALVNLLINAIKYSPDKNHIDVLIEGNDKMVTIRVQDYGIGIEKKDQQKIFERFYRVEGKSEQTYPGFGIGLFISSEIIQRHNGHLSVESEKGKGSVFSIHLPAGTSNQRIDSNK